MRHSFYGLDHVQLAAPAGCEEEARWFFAELLGMVQPVIKSSGFHNVVESDTTSLRASLVKG